MVDVSSQSNKVNITVSSSGVSSNVIASGDTSHYYSEKAREWATSNRIVDGVDYSSKYYAEKSNQSALNAQNFAQSAQDSYKQFQQSVDGALSTVNDSVQGAITTIDTTKDTAIDSINSTKTTILNDIEFVADGEKEEIKDLADLIKDSAEDIINRASLQLFDTILKDHILTYKESKGLALQGTYVYKEAIAGSRYGYADFYNKVVEEYQNSSNTKQYLKSNVNLVGSLNDNQGVLSGFSTANYATLPNRFAPTASDTWEVVLKINRLSTNDGGLLGYNSTGLFNFNIVGSKLCLHLSTVTNSWNIGEITGQTTLSTNTDYWAKVAFDGSSYQIFLSTDGDLYTIEGTLTSSSVPVYPTTTMLGICNTFAYNGIIDLNESYININGERWWTGVETYEVYKNSNGHIFYDISEKDKVDEVFNQFGTAWFYGVDTENERVFLPRNNYFEQATGDITEVGQSVEAGLPNITGSGNFDVNSNETGDNWGGAFYCKMVGSEGSTGDSLSSTRFYFDASRSNPIYSNSDTVQPPAVKKLLYVCVGNTETVSSVTDVVDVTTTNNDTVPLFTGLYFDFKPNNASWLKAGQQSNSGGIYATCYNELINVLNGETKYGDLKVVDTANMIAGIDYSEYWKVNQDEMTFTTPSVAGLFPNNRILVAKKEPTDSDTTWYNLYSDGWCEQGGRVNSVAYDSAIKNVTFLIPMKDSNYYATAVPLTDGTNDGSWNISARVAGLTTTQMTVRGGLNANGAYTGICNWEISGYAEIPTVSEYTENVNLYFKVANAVQNLELLDVGKVMEEAVLKSQLVDAQVVVETYVNGTSWYRVYSDGWCEQGGVHKHKATANETVTLLKAYKDTSYSVLSTYGTSSSNQYGQAWVTDESTITLKGYTGYNVYWRTSGYIA